MDHFFKYLFTQYSLAQTRLSRYNRGGQAWHAKHEYKELIYEIL